MKTFRLVAISLVHGEEVEQLDLQDGLIINREYGKENWLIEALLPKDKPEMYEEFRDNEEMLHVQATISKPTNAPASFEAVVRQVAVMEDKMSILFEGELFRKNTNYHEKLLERLVNEGYNGDELVEAFKNKVKEKPVLEKSK
ncbi:YwpF-like family protein [Sutcliffiella horikoshii]|uniref:YwpF-like family protein n=1 Tax=Sutcliffiella horikoshii TaxID=79883 RepID=UPI001CFF345D|nr:YwpF-like family protein [Sutcliffiella horikoshii]